MNKVPEILDLADFMVPPLIEEEDDPPVQLCCPECESEEFELYSDGLIKCAACGTEMELEAHLPEEEIEVELEDDREEES